MMYLASLLMLALPTALAFQSTAILKVAYDGTHFRGSSGQSVVPKQTDASKKHPQPQPSQPTKRRQSRRSRTLQRKGGKRGTVRTVEGTLQLALAKIYGDVDPTRIEIDSCSRTDAGVHATSLVVQFYCSSNTATRGDEMEEGRLSEALQRRPSVGDDASFLPLPFDSDLSKLVFVLNRMLPPDLRLVAASPLPEVCTSTPIKGDSIPSPESGPIAFHPTLHTASKTYAYQFGIGPIHDPLQTKYVWHLDGSSANAVGMNWKRFDLERALSAANLFVDPAPRDFGAFRSAFRGTDRGRVQSPMCKLWQCDIVPERRELLPSWETKSDEVSIDGGHKRFGGRLGKSESVEFVANPQTFTVVITGDRFLYKMVRNIVGSIVAVGCGHLELDDVRTALEVGSWGGKQSSIEEDLEKDDEEEESMLGADGKTIRRICAPARGLKLVNVQYPEDVHFDWQSG
ncbi:hypothetical protein ACHAXT_004399 [Thalassiosira profunda]